MTDLSAVSAVIRSLPQFTKQTADFRRSCFPLKEGTTAEVCGKVCGGFRSSAVQIPMEAEE